MLMDVPGAAGHRAYFETWEQLERYMWGSAAVIGLQMMPILGTRPSVERAEAEPYAAALGRAFQLTNFLRDIAEDLGRGRIYVPLSEWAAFGVDPEQLSHCARTGTTTPQVRRAIAFVIARNRSIYSEAAPGIAMLDAPGRQAIRAADVLYSDILREIERADYNVFARRARVGRARRLSIAAPLALCGVAGAARTRAARAGVARAAFARAKHSGRA